MRDVKKPNADNGEHRAYDPIAKSVACATWVIAFAAIATFVAAGLQVFALWQADETNRAAQRPFVTAAELVIRQDMPHVLDVWRPRSKQREHAYKELAVHGHLLPGPTR